jgi:hypothetical protein
MSTRWWRIIFDNATGLYIAGAVALGAIAAASLALNGGLPGLAAAVMRPQSVEAPWTEAIRVVDEALAAGDVSAAGRAWTEAYNAAQRSRRWEGLLAAGDARVRIDQAAGGGKPVRARAAYLAALWRARQKGSLEGVLQAAEAFDSLGDAAAAAEALRIAEAVAGRDPGPAVLARIAALRESWGPPLSTARREDEGLLVEP